MERALKDSSVGSLFNVKVVLGLFLAVALTFMWAGAVHAQSADDQYGQPVAPSGPAAGAQCVVPDDTDGVVGPGDTVICEGDYTVSDGSSVVLQDSDNTQGTFVDGENSEITTGSLIIEVLGDPLNVAGGNDVLNTEGLFVVATTGISAADDGGTADDGAVAEAGDGEAVAVAGDGEAVAVAGDSDSEPASALAGVLPDTGGPVLLGILGVTLLLGGGLLAIHRRRSSR